MNDGLTIGVSILTLLTLASGLYLAAVRFGLKRERATFLRVSIHTSIVAHNNLLALVNVVVCLENKGDTRINARTHRDLEKPSKFLYDDTWDQCEHAGTLKLRPIPLRDAPRVFDWYALATAPATIERCTVADQPHQVACRPGDLEQINYLGEYQDPKVDFTDVDFWLEPRETYELSVPMWLLPGAYAAKATFLGQRTEPREEEFWTSTHVFVVPSSGAAEQVVGRERRERVFAS
jgi:hypothetical protein